MTSDGHSQRHATVCLAALIVAAGFLGGCRTAVNFDAIQGAQTAAQIKTSLVNDPDLGAATIEVSVTQGVASLSGTVPTQADVDRAAALARAVPGVRGVELRLKVGGDTPAPAEAPPPPLSEALDELPQLRDDPRLFAVGVSIGLSAPSLGALGSHVTVGPLVRLGSGRGLGPALALDWFQTPLAGASTTPGIVSRIDVRPIMAGLSYTMASERVSVSPSLVGGVAFNSLTVPTSGAAPRIAVEVGNSLVWRPGASMWIDVSRRAAINVSAGYVFTGLRVTFLENGQLVRRDVRGDTTVVHAGVAYKLF